MLESPYARCIRQAEETKRNHAARARQQVYAAAQRCPLCFDDGRGGLDTIKIEDRARADWWVNPHLWLAGKARSFTLDTRIEDIALHAPLAGQAEKEAFDNLRQIALELTGTRRLTY